MFQAADSYERFMGRWSQKLTPLLVEFSGLREARAVLDVGCGTGALAAAVRQRLPACTVVGIDRSLPFTTRAHQQFQQRSIHVAVADAQQLPFADHQFDAALCSLILNFVPDPHAAASELRRVTRRGGTAAAAVWDYGGGMEMLRAFWDAVAELDPSAREDERQMRLSARGELEELFAHCGFGNVTGAPLEIEMPFVSFDDYWMPFLGGTGPAGAYVSGLAVERRDELRARLVRRLTGDVPDSSFTLRARAWAVRGQC